MKRVALLLIAGALATPAWAQPTPSGQGGAPRAGGGNGRASYQPAVAAPSTTVYGGGGYGYGGGGASTAQGDALQGMSQVISAAGQYNLNTSAAAINMTQAEKNQMENNVQGVSTFWQMREDGAAARARERERINGPMPSPEEFARRARAAAPNPLSSREMDPVSGKLNWPNALQDPSFSAQREAVDPLVAKWVNYGALDYSDRNDLRETLNGLFASMKEQMAQIPPQDFVNAKSFIRSVLFATTSTTL